MNESILTNCRLIFYLQFRAQKFLDPTLLKKNDFRDLGKLKIYHF